MIVFEFIILIFPQKNDKLFLFYILLIYKKNIIYHLDLSIYKSIIDSSKFIYISMIYNLK